MKKSIYIAISVGATVLALAALLAPSNQMPQSALVILVLVVVFGIPPFGAFWMMYEAIRYEKRPLPMVLLAAFVPFSFLWYYFERVRPGKLRRTRNFA